MEPLPLQRVTSEVSRHSLGTSLLSGPARCYRCIGRVPGSLGNRHFCQGVHSFRWRNGFRNQDLGTKSAHCHWLITAPGPSQWTKKCVCVSTSTHLPTYLCNFPYLCVSVFLSPFLCYLCLYPLCSLLAPGVRGGAWVQGSTAGST